MSLKIFFGGIFLKVLRKICKIFLIFFVLALLSVCAACGILYYKYYPVYLEYRADAVRAVAESDEDTFKKNLSSYIYDDSGSLISRLSVDANADYLDYEEIPKRVIQAFTAVEDRRFWEHEGYDMK